MEAEMQEGGSTGESTKRIWILVDHSTREAAMEPVAEALRGHGHEVELVTITEVFGSVAREALAGGAERILRGLRVAMKGRGEDEDLLNAFRRRRPDMLVITESRFVRAIGVLENLTGVASLQIGLVSEFTLNPTWFSGQVHGLIVPDEETLTAVREEGMPEGRIQLGGPALRGNFKHHVDRDHVRRELGLGDDLVVLVRADGIEQAILEKLVFQCTLVDREVRFVFHHDSDGSTATVLRRAADQFGLSAAMFGRVDDLERYFAAADAMLMADDDGYLAEALSSRTPLLFVPSGRPERGNALALKAKGFADALDDIGQLGTRLDSFLRAKNLSTIGSALAGWEGEKRSEAIIPALEYALAQAIKWRHDAPSATPDATGVSEPKPTKTSSPFETIGRSGRPNELSSEPGKTTEKVEESGAGTMSMEAPRLSQAEARDELAKLILKERDLERQLEDIAKQQERWRGRLDLAREWNEADLAEEAEEILKGYLQEARPMEESLREIRTQKDKLKTAARDGRAPVDGIEGKRRASEREERFRKMETDRDLRGLKDRIKREFGE